MTVVQIGDNARFHHGQVKPPCSSCVFPRDEFGYNQ